MSEPTNSVKEPRRASPIRRWAPVVVILLAMVLVFAQGWHTSFFRGLIENRNWLQTRVAEYGLLAGLAYMGIYIAAVSLSLPGATILTILGGFLFGWLFGGLMTIVAATIGATVIFLAARTALGDTLRARAGPVLEKIGAGFEQDAASYMLFLRLVPAFPFWLVNLAPAFSQVKLTTFVWTTFIGIAPGSFAFSYAGTALDSAIAGLKCAAGDAACPSITQILSALTRREVLFAFAALGIVALIPIGVKAWRRRGSGAMEPDDSER